METLKSNRDFERVFRKGRSASHRDLLVLGRKRRPFHVRVGFCISRKVGKAVVRNKLRRRLLEIVREFEPGLDPRWDLVIVTRPSCPKLNFWELRKTLRKQLKKLGVLDSQPAPATPSSGDTKS